ncbi:MAG TPA: radical SAM protein, partial [Gemmatimonadaceae bacterium]|nr:radical SAM protein [Gemmatimonadaceae bacterium]
LRRDLEDIVSAVDRAVRLKYVTMITHGGMLGVERARSLWDAGINQFSISLDFLDERHDHARGIPGLAHRILDTVPRLRASGIDNVRFNTVIKDENLDHVMDIARAAHELGIGVGFSTYTDMKNGNAAHYPRRERLALVDALIGDLLAFKRRHRGVITSSDWYLRQIPRYFRGELRDPCASGLRTIHIDPAGFVRRCPDFPADVHWREFRPYAKIDCNACFYACRGEAQAPLTLSRVRDVVA